MPHRREYRSASGKLVTLAEALDELRPFCPDWISPAQLEQMLGFAGGDVCVCLEDMGVDVNAHGALASAQASAPGVEQQQLLAEELLAEEISRNSDTIIDHQLHVDQRATQAPVGMGTSRDGTRAPSPRRRLVGESSLVDMLHDDPTSWLSYVGPACACIGPLLLLVCLGILYVHVWTIFMSASVAHWPVRTCQIMSNTTYQERPYVGLRANVLVRHGQGNASVTQMAFSSPDGSFSTDPYAWQRTHSWTRGYESRVGDEFACIVNPMLGSTDCTSAIGCGRSAGGVWWECCGFRVLLGHAGSYPNPFPVASLLWALGAIVVVRLLLPEVVGAWELCCCPGRLERPVSARRERRRSRSKSDSQDLF